MVKVRLDTCTPPSKKIEPKHKQNNKNEINKLKQQYKSTHSYWFLTSSKPFLTTKYSMFFQDYHKISAETL